MIPPPQIRSLGRSPSRRSSLRDTRAIYLPRQSSCPSRWVPLGFAALYDHFGLRSRCTSCLHRQNTSCPHLLVPSYTSHRALIIHRHHHHTHTSHIVLPVFRLRVHSHHEFRRRSLSRWTTVALTVCSSLVHHRPPAMFIVVYLSPYLLRAR